MNARNDTLDSILGQEELRERLAVAIKSAVLRNDVIPHLLLSGKPGVGKTTFGYAMANELGCEALYVNCATVRSPKQFLPYLMKIKQNTIFLMDEIHALPGRVQENLYTVLEDNRLDVLQGEECISVDIPKFTAIGCTTNEGDLKGPLLSRFPLREYIRPYRLEELCLIVKSVMLKLDLSLTDDSVEHVAKMSRGIPRNINNIILKLRDFILVENLQPNYANVVKLLAKFGLDEQGLTYQDRDYLRVLKNLRGTASLPTISLTLGVSKTTIEEVIEPYLLELNLIKKTTKGRELIG